MITFIQTKMKNKKKLNHRLTKEKKSKAKAKAKIIKTVGKLAKNQALNLKTID